MRELIEEERPFCDEGNYDHMAQILTSIALHEVLQARPEAVQSGVHVLFEHGARAAV